VILKHFILKPSLREFHDGQNWDNAILNVTRNRHFPTYVLSNLTTPLSAVTTMRHNYSVSGFDLILMRHYQCAYRDDGILKYVKIF